MRGNTLIIDFSFIFKQCFIIIVSSNQVEKVCFISQYLKLSGSHKLGTYKLDFLKILDLNLYTWNSQNQSVYVIFTKWVHFKQTWNAKKKKRKRFSACLHCLVCILTANEAWKGEMNTPTGYLTQDGGHSPPQLS